MDNSSDDEVFLSDGAQSGGENQKTRHNSNRVRTLPDDETVKQMVFTSCEEADLFYINYGREMGFDVRKCSLGMSKDKSVLENNTWQCVCAGFPKELSPTHQRIRTERVSKKCGCLARFRISLDRHRGFYRVTGFCSSHNHALATAETKDGLKSSRYISAPQKAIIALLGDAGIRPCQIIKYLEQVEHNILFKKKDVYNLLGKERKDTIRNGDVKTVLSLFEGMKMVDPNLIVENTCNDDKSLTRLFWCDGFSRAAYDKFGDVLIMDSTYKTNRYNFPLVILSGIDNHKKSIIFGAALMFNETAESYIWLLKTFLATMKGKGPLSVVTDQDEAMRHAIKEVFPNAIHRLCGWHLSRNCAQKVEVHGFCTVFSKLMMARWSIEDFERAWKEETGKHGVAEISWVKDTYERRSNWSESYLRGHFMGMTRTTQRAESLNSLFKNLGKAGSTITEFIRQFYRVVKSMRSTFLEEQKESVRAPPNIKCSAPLYALRNQVAKIYTRSVAADVEKEIMSEQNFFVIEQKLHGYNKFIFVLEKYGQQCKKQWEVKVDISEAKFTCVCKALESDGLPCRHLFTVFKNMNLESIPPHCIRERWTIGAGKELRENFQFMAIDPQLKRFMVLHQQCSDLCQKASHSEHATAKSVKRVRRAVKEVEETNVDSISSHQKKCDKSSGIRAPQGVSQKHDALRDPHKVVSRGAPKTKKQNCRSCGKPGHKSTTCERKSGIAKSGNAQKRKFNSEDATTNKDD